MNAGRKLDALVAEKVMGFDVRTPESHPNPTVHLWCKASGVTMLEDRYGEVRELPHYSTSIKDAWEVVEKLQEEYAAFRLWYSFRGWQCSWNKKPEILVPADEAPLAICIAALKAKGIEVPPA